ncbi:hypothetical protein OMP38_17410 [Cohnella ginsengisoli]|uniref:Uncharacterized protein n=1 Tax=Cohnella ginsengisoli TaxID=425004 RepID=A0A9X4QMU0_9BACL|nr:hypothetical protein [Cohnella ginsengisoli]MDG0792454.1 hypothetical protein [Cohnella ginsengisoli]
MKRKAAVQHRLSLFAAGRMYRLWTREPLFPLIGSIWLDFGLGMYDS